MIKFALFVCVLFSVIFFSGIAHAGLITSFSKQDLLDVNERQKAPTYLESGYEHFYQRGIYYYREDLGLFLNSHSLQRTQYPPDKVLRTSDKIILRALIAFSVLSCFVGLYIILRRQKFINDGLSLVVVFVWIVPFGITQILINFFGLS